VTTDPIRVGLCFGRHLTRYDCAIENFYTSGSSTTSVNTTKGAIDEALYSFAADHLGWYVGSTLSKPSGVTGESFAEYFQKRAGYRLYLESLSYPRKGSVGDSVSFDQVWHQRGVSKMYLKPKFAVDLVRDGQRYPIGEVDFAASNWALGPQGPIPSQSTMKIPDLPPGEYQVSFALVDQKRRPMINIAIDRKEVTDVHAYSFYNAGSITVRP
jgi:hypothetical protein